MTYELPDIIDSKKLSKALTDAFTILRRNIIKFQDFFPASATSNGIYSYSPIESNCYRTFSHHDKGWWNGMIWLLYETEKDIALMKYAEKTCKMISNHLKNKSIIDTNTGILVIPSCVPLLRQNDNSIAKEAIISAANSLLNKYNYKNQFICSYENELEGDTLCSIITNLLNNQVLDFAYKLSKDDKYRKVFVDDTKTTINNNILKNGRVYFRRYYDKKDAYLVKRDRYLPYYGNFMCETKGFSWAMYGLAVKYKSTGNIFYKQTFDKIFSYLEKANIYEHGYYRIIDKKSDTNDVHPETTVIAGAALTEMIKSSPGSSQLYCRKLSEIVNDIIDLYSISPDSPYEGLVESSVSEKQKHCSLACDYFYLEMLMNIKYERKSFWYDKKSDL